MRFVEIILTPVLFSFLTSSVAFAGEDTREPDLEAERAVERKCLECHNNPALYGARKNGELRSVYVDIVRYRKSLHYEEGYTCLTCHPGAVPEFHPREGVAIKACGSCHDHEDELADFSASLHGKALKESGDGVPDCFSCHSNHYTRKKDDPEALVNGNRIRETCGACHPEEAEIAQTGAWWSGGRISAHGKSDLSESYGIFDCKRCHVGADTHMKRESGDAPSCVACHGRGAPSEGRGPVVGAVHLTSPVSLGERLSMMRGAGLVLSAGAFLLLVIPVVALLARRRREETDEKKGAVEEESE